MSSKLRPSLDVAEDVRYIPGPLPTSEVIYYQTNVDSNNLPLDASNGSNYTITFQLPIPAKYFWSLIMYNATSLNLIYNPINRYSISDRVSLAFNPFKILLLARYVERAVEL